MVVVVVASSPTSGRISDETTVAGDDGDGGGGGGGGGGCKTRGIALSYRLAQESDEAPPIVCRRCRRIFFVSRSLSLTQNTTCTPRILPFTSEEGRADDESCRTFFFTETAAASRYFGAPSFVRSSQSSSWSLILQGTTIARRNDLQTQR